MTGHVQRSRREFLRLAAIGATGTAISLLAAPAALAAPVSVPGDNAWYAGGLQVAQSVTLPADAAPLDQQTLKYMIKEDRYIASGIGGYNVMWDLRAMLFESQTAYTNDWGYEKGMADSWDVSPDGTVYTFHLKPGMTWSDGQPITADDYVNHYKILLDPANATDVAWYFFPILNGQEINNGQADVNSLGAVALDANTLQVTLKEPTPYWSQFMAYGDPRPYAKHLWDQWGNVYYTSLESTATSGYWKVTNWTKGQGIVAEARTDYAGNYPGYLQRIEFPFGEAPTHFAAYQRGETDIVLDIPAPGDVAAIMNDPTLSQELHTWPQWFDWYLLFHTQDGPYKDLRARQAVSHAIDRDAIVNGPLKNLAVPSYTITPPGFPGNQVDDPTIREIQNYDPDTARKLLADAGYPNGQGFPEMDLWIRGTGGAIVTQQAAAEAIQAMLKDILGIRVNLRPEDAQIYMSNLGKYQIGITLLSWNFDFTDPVDMVAIPFRSKYPAEGGRLDWKNDQFDALCDQAGPVSDIPTRYKMYQDAERILLQDVGAVTVYHPISHQLWKPWVKGIVPTKDGITQWANIKNQAPFLYIGSH
jgi:peptide/nickel transport system substrate-binding protein/oligopeptide transport system substrate-binding protein